MNNNTFSLSDYHAAIYQVNKDNQKPVGVIVNGKFKNSLIEMANNVCIKNVKKNEYEAKRKFDPIFGGELKLYALPVYFDTDLGKDYEAYYDKKKFEKKVWANYIRDAVRLGVSIDEIFEENNEY